LKQILCALVVLAIALPGCDRGDRTAPVPVVAQNEPTQQSWHADYVAGAAPVCDSAERFPPRSKANASGGFIVLYHHGDAKGTWSVDQAFAGLAAERPQEIETLVCIKGHQVQVGQYVGTRVAGMRTQWTISIFRSRDRALVAQRRFEGGLPPESITATRNSRWEPPSTVGGSAPTGEGYAWITETLRPANVAFLQAAPREVAFSMDERLLAFASARGKVYVAELDPERARPLAPIAVIDDRRVRPALAFSPTERVLAVTMAGDMHGQADSVRLFDLDGRTLRPGEMQASEVRKLVFSPNGQYLAAHGAYGAKVWSVRNLTEVAKFGGSSRGRNTLAFSDDSRHVYIGDDDGRVRQYTVADSALIRTLARSDRAIDQLVVHEGRTLITATADTTKQGRSYLPEIVKWSLPPRRGFFGGDQPDEAHEGHSWTRGLGFMHDLKELAEYEKSPGFLLIPSGTDPPMLIHMDLPRALPTVSFVRSLSIPYFDNLRAAALSPSGRRLAVSGYVGSAGTVRLFDVTTLGTGVEPGRVASGARR